MVTPCNINGYESQRILAKNPRNFAKFLRKMAKIQRHSQRLILQDISEWRCFRIFKTIFSPRMAIRDMAYRIPKGMLCFASNKPGISYLATNI